MSACQQNQCFCVKLLINIIEIAGVGLQRVHASCSTRRSCVRPTRIRNTTDTVEGKRSNISRAEEASTLNNNAVPAISAPSERVVSLAGNICSRRCASLSPDHQICRRFGISTVNANGDLFMTIANGYSVK